MKIRGPGGPGPVKGVPLEGAEQSEQVEPADPGQRLDPTAEVQTPPGVAEVSAALRSGVRSACASVRRVVRTRSASKRPVPHRDRRSEALARAARSDCVSPFRAR